MPVTVLVGDSDAVTAAAATLVAARPCVVVDLVGNQRDSGHDSGRANGHGGQYLEFASYAASDLPPQHAAAVDGLAALDFADTARRIGDLDAVHDDVLVLGRHGLLTPYRAADRWTVVDLASSLRAPVLPVVRAQAIGVEWAALGLARLAEESVACTGLLVVDWPPSPDRTHWYALTDLAAMAALAGVVPAEPKGVKGPRETRQRARTRLVPQLGGTFDAARFLARGH